MKVEKLTLKNFRNVQDCSFTPDPSVNFLVGANGQGKTSFLEALSFLSTLRSFRDSKASHVVNWDCISSEIACTLVSDETESGDWKTDLRIVFQIADKDRQKTTKTASINGKPFHSSTQYLSQKFGSFNLGFHTIIFNPSDHDLVRGDPSIRRAYLDRTLAAEDLKYLNNLQKYQRVLAQRNSLLKVHPLPSPDLFQGFTEQLCALGAHLTFMRLSWIDRINQRLDQTLRQIAPDQPPLRLVYLSSWVPLVEGLSLNNRDLNSVHFAGQGPVPSLELLEQSFLSKAAAAGAVELRMGYSLVGPHRDDWTFYLGDQALKGHGSQGEVRSALLALKLSEIELFRSETGHRPLFLLDDFSSELDRERRLFLLRFLTETDLQTFVTTTEDLAFTGKRFVINNGTIEEGRHDQRNTTHTMD